MFKILYLVGSVVCTVIILLLAFENIQGMCSYLVFFFTDIPTSFSPTFLILGVAFLGGITGFFYTSLVYSLFGGKDDEDEEVSPEEKNEQAGF